MEEEFFEKLKEKILPYFEDGTSHEFSHTQRVLNHSLKLAEGENVDLDVIKASALLHDIARVKEDSGKVKCHAEEGSKMAKKILEELNFPKDKINHVVACISTHRKSRGLKPESREAAILWDADKLELFGAAGIGRTFIRGFERRESMSKTFLTSGSNKQTIIDRFNRRILAKDPKDFHTSKAKKIAKESYKYTKDFVDRLIKECYSE
jgi:uncharacterized protein